MEGIEERTKLRVTVVKTFFGKKQRNHKKMADGKTRLTEPPPEQTSTATERRAAGETDPRSSTGEFVPPSRGFTGKQNDPTWSVPAEREPGKRPAHSF